jgi:hypothetical protein
VTAALVLLPTASSHSFMIASRLWRPPGQFCLMVLPSCPPLPPSTLLHLLPPLLLALALMAAAVASAPQQPSSLQQRRGAILAIVP